MKRLGLARRPEDPLGRVVAEAGWEPVPFFPTEMAPTGSPCPLAHPDAILLLSPAGAQAPSLPKGAPFLVTGEGTAATLPGREVLVSPEPRAEGLWTLLRQRFPGGGDFLLVRGERSRGYLEEAAAGTPWRLVSWVTHAEKSKEPLPAMPALEGILALSPLQAEVLAPLSSGIQRFAWGERTAEAFRRAGFPAHDSCLAKPEALGCMLASYV